MDNFLAERGVFRSRTYEPGYDPLVLLITLLRTVINTKDKCHFESNLEVHIIDQVHYNEALYFEIDEGSVRNNLFNEKSFAACFMYSSSFQETLMFLPINLIFKLVKASPTKNTLKDHDNYLRIAPVSSRRPPTYPVEATPRLIQRSGLPGVGGTARLRALGRRC